MCDQVSDAILDAHLKQDPDAKVACETVTKTGMIMVGFSNIWLKYSTPGSDGICVIQKAMQLELAALQPVLDKRTKKIVKCHPPPP